jgi:hypothetical protein
LIGCYGFKGALESSESLDVVAFLGFLFLFSTNFMFSYPNHGNSKIKTKNPIKRNVLEIDVEIDIRVFARGKKCVENGYQVALAWISFALLKDAKEL